MSHHPWQRRTADAVNSDELSGLDRWWRAANYLSVGQIYLLANPLLRVPLHRDHVKPRLVGHWGTTPGLGTRAASLRQDLADRRLAARRYAREHGVDIPEVAGWVWPDADAESKQAFAGAASTGGDND